VLVSTGLVVLIGVWLVVLDSIEVVVPDSPGLDVLVVVSEVVAVDDPVTGGALPVMTHEQAEEMRDGMLWHCDT
jgi:hypothetical protein